MEKETHQLITKVNEPVYSFEDIWLLKDDKPCICPVNSGLLKPSEKLTLQGKQPLLEINYLTCNSTCPFMKGAEKRFPDTGKVINGVVLLCQSKNIFLEILEN
jgi:hypothetical protein